MLLNATQRHYQPQLNNFSNVDYIFTSLEDGKTRPEIEQPIGKPFEYRLGIQGKNIGRCDISIADKNKPVRDVSSQMMMAEIFSQRLSKLQEKDPKRRSKIFIKIARMFWRRLNDFARVLNLQILFLKILPTARLSRLCH